MLKYLFITPTLLFFPLVAQGASLDVIINEIAWMGTENSANDEWIELYNNTNQDINLEGWGLYEAGGPARNASHSDADGETLIESFKGVIKANSYYLIERTDDTTVPNIPASQEPSGWEGYGLKNSGEHLQLLNNEANIIDEVNCSSGWFAGDNETKQTMERINSLASGNEPSNWQTSENAGGTPKAENSKQETVNSKQETKEEFSGVEPSKTEEKVEVKPLTSYPEGIVLNEILPSPEGPDAENEWIEIFNQNDFEVNLSGWKIKDKEGRITVYTFPEDTKISPEGYLVLSRPITKITLNNSGDGLSLIQPDEEITDSTTYQKAPREQSYNRTTSGWFWGSVLTPGKPNKIPEKISMTESSLAELGEVEPRSAEFSPEEGMAGIAKNLSQSSYQVKGKLSIFLMALIVAIFSGIIILILKKKLEEKIF